MTRRPAKTWIAIVVALLGALLFAVPAAASVTQFALTVHKTGTGTGTVECEVVGSGVAAPCASKYPEGTELALYAIPNPGSKFVEWSGDCAGEYCELLMEEAHAVTAEFALIPEFALTVHETGTGTGTVECEVVGSGVAAPCAGKYPEGTELALYAEASPGSEFVEWSGDCAGEYCELLMEEAHAVTASFALPEFPLTVAKAGTGTGTVECEVVGSGVAGPCAPEYPEGTALRLVATPDAGAEFAGWSGDCAGASCELTMYEAHAVTATFNLEPPPPPPPPPPPSEPPPPPPPSPGEAGVFGAVRVKGGEALLELSCRGPGACAGVLKLVAKLKPSKGKAAVIGSAPFNLAAAASETLRVRLSRQVNRLLKSGKALKAAIAGSGIEPRTVKLR